MSKERIGERRANINRRVEQVGIKGAIARLGAAALVASLAITADQNRGGTPTAQAQSIVRVDDIPPWQMIEYDGPVEAYCQQGDTVGLRFASSETFWWVQRFIHRVTRQPAHQRQLAEAPDCRSSNLPELEFGPAAIVPPAISEPSVARCGQSTALSAAIGELRGVGFPGPFEVGSVQAAINRTVICGVQPTGECDPLQVTTLAPRPDAVIDGKPVALPVRDKNSGCERAVWLKETGVAKGENFKLDLPHGWSVVISPTTVAVHREGGVQRDFLNGDVVVVNGPFKGGAGVYEGWIGALPTEWAAKVAGARLVIQRIENRRPNSQIVTFVG